MKPFGIPGKPLLPVLLSSVLLACGDGDEYEGFDATVSNAEPDSFLTFFNEQQGKLDDDDLTRAYYEAVDPGDARTSAQDYLALHGLDNPDVHVIFRDSKDLGYGRDMYMSSYPNPSACGGHVIAFFVRNFSVEVVDGFAYGPVNLDAAISQDLQHHVGSNAIEVGLGRADVGDPCSSEPIAKFYTYQPVYDPPGADHPRRTRVDLDGRGNKAMPQPCITCHGGTLRPLDRFGRFVAVHANDQHDPTQNPPISDIGTTKARLQAFEVDTFGFSGIVGHRRSDYEEGLRLLNNAVFCTYAGSASPTTPAAVCADFGGGVAAKDPTVDTENRGEWSGGFARDMLQGWYGGELEVAGSEFDISYIPDGWKPEPGGAPVGADNLFEKVIGPNCFVCHGKQGTQLPSNQDSSLDGRDIDFSTWGKFISYADDIERLVFDEGKMPLGLLNFNTFWGDPEKGELLASYIAPYVTAPGGFEARRTDASGNIIPPGRVLPRAGPDRVTLPDAMITLNAGASLFADGFRWTVDSAPANAVTSLSAPNSAVTDFSADSEGEYVVSLVASNSVNASSNSDTLTIRVDSGLATAPRDLAFYDDISDFMTNAARGNCVQCHAAGVQPGVPVWWVPDANQPAGATTGIPASINDPPALGFYEQVMARVNLAFVEDSPLLKKPSGQHHFGGLVNGAGGGLDASVGVGSAGRADFDMIVNWISEGAECGAADARCP